MKHYLLPLLLAFFWMLNIASVPVPDPEQSNAFVIEGLSVEWEYAGDQLTFKLHSPYQGWVALGFNEQNDIVNTNLVMGAVTDDATKMEEFYVVGFGNPQPVTQLGGQTAVSEFLGVEDAAGTSFQFTIDTNASDDFHYDLSAGNTIWLICAYSLEDDFGHHSIMRRHLEITL